MNTELSLERVKTAVTVILETLGDPETEPQTQALDAFKNGEQAIVKRLSAIHLEDFYIKSLGYLGSAEKLTPNTDTILAESARAAGEWVRERTIRKLGSAIASALNG